jgi:hypothetical protein
MEQRYQYTAFGTRYNVWLEKAKYANKRVALLLNDDEGQVACATVNMPEIDLQPDEVIIKTWSENEAMLDFLIHNHIVADTGREVQAGYEKARVCKLLV